MIRTQWFEGENPVHVGEYETQSDTDASETGQERRWWNGYRWSLFYFENESQQERDSCASIPAGADITAWRGQIEAPK